MSTQQQLRFDGRVALITGAGRGLGRAYALELARRGCAVVVNDLGVHTDGSDAGEDRAGAVVAEIEALGGRALANRDTVATVDGGRAMVEATVEHFGRIDIVVNNAGPKGGALFGTLDDALVQKIIQGHLVGAFNVTRPAWRHFLAQGYGRVVMTSSQAVLGIPGTAPYAAAKGGMIGLTNELAAEATGTGITVNALLPTARTPGNDGIRNEAFRAWFAPFVPEQVAPVLAYLCHESCVWSGEKIIAGGGRVSRLFLASTPGVFSADLTMEHVAASVAEITAEPGYAVSRSAMEDMWLWTDAYPWADPSVPMSLY